MEVFPLTRVIISVNQVHLINSIWLPLTLLIPLESVKALKVFKTPLLRPTMIQCNILSVVIYMRFQDLVRTRSFYLCSNMKDFRTLVELSFFILLYLVSNSLLLVVLCFCICRWQYIKIPVPTPESPDGFRVFSFYLSSDSKDKPQSSFDCIHQYVSG